MSFSRLLPAVLPGITPRGSFTLHLEPQPELVAAARAFVLAHAPPMPEDTRDALVLLTSELVTNGILHAGTPLEVGITLLDDAVVVSVHDLDTRRPEQLPYSGREGGWGLGLVAALATQSSLDPHPDGGKTAWFRLETTALPAVADNAAVRQEDPAVDRGPA